MDNIVIVETSQHVKNSISFTNIRQELISQSFSLAGTLYEACDIHDIYSGRHYPLRVAKVCKCFKPLVRNVSRTEIWLYCAERKVCALGLS